MFTISQPQTPGAGAGGDGGRPQQPPPPAHARPVHTGDQAALQARTDRSAVNPTPGTTLPGEVAHGPGVVITALAEMLARSIVDEAKLAYMLRVSTRTVRRMVTRTELPRPVKLGGRATWFAGDVLDHIAMRAEALRREAEKDAARIKKHFCNPE